MEANSLELINVYIWINQWRAHYPPPRAARGGGSNPIAKKSGSLCHKNSGSRQSCGSEIDFKQYFYWDDDDDYSGGDYDDDDNGGGGDIDDK